MRYHKKLFVLALAGGLLFGQAALKSHQIRSANLTSVSVTLSTPRLSFLGKLDANNSVGSSVVRLQTTPGAAPSTSSAQLAEGDSVWIGNADNGRVYTVASASSTADRFTIKAPNFAALQTSNADNNDSVISTQSATHTVRFTTSTAVQDGTFQILVPATVTAGAGQDGIPDSDGFDFGGTAPTVTCPGDITSTYDFGTGAAAAEAVTLGSTTYHSFECSYTGTGESGVAFDGTTNAAITIDSLINPSPKGNHVEGYADTYKILVRHLDSSDTIVDTTTVTVGVNEAVRVTASVPPQITFAVLGLSAGTSACGISTNVATTATTVPFGEISISSFTNAAQGLTVSTNAQNGFTVSAIANDEMGLNGQECAGNPTANGNCIPDASATGMSHTTSAEWTSTTDKGFGYSIHDVNSSTTESFAYNESSRTFSAKQFADNESAQVPQTLFSATSPQENDNVYVCYRIVVSSTQPAGDYENYVTYRATATF